MSAPDAGGGPFRVLHVCTGNICRSPMAEAMMRVGLEQRLGERAAAFEVASAGTLGFPDSPMEDLALATLAGHGIDGAAFRARSLVADLVASSDLVLGATREHRAAAVVLHPRASARTFTLREFDRLCAQVDPAELPPADGSDGLAGRARALVRAAAGKRGLVPPASPGDDDVEDPYRGPESAFRGAAALVSASLERPLDLLAGP